MKFYERVISDFGGYEKCKDILSQPNIDFIMNAQGLREHMLEYRRQHNIFEVGDIAVNSRGDESRLLKIWRVDMCAHNSKMSIADYDAESLGGWSRFHALRHATDAEIKAGRKL